ncbi:hypothetical protein [Campylobacter ureolyticus]|uniref:hypothetical protein n=1 Tax=Campylobacter ureolyticus TaxID=827 RepID=UPI002910C902|nr:hypothetical protein [Campylobacter ureolyticus]MDU7070051.1 hypothetical protein [Campylobacter ureolyticus]
MILSEDFKCPHCGKENNAAELEEYLENDFSSNEINEEKEVICECCKRKFKIEIETEILPNFTITKISKIED